MSHEPRVVTFVLTGLGNIGRTLLEILSVREEALRSRYGVVLRCVGVADSTGAAYAPGGFKMGELAGLKRAGRGVAHLPECMPGLSAAALTATAEAELLLEATPTNLRDGQPGLGIVLAALRAGKHAILASKGPLVLAYQELVALGDLGVPGWTWRYGAAQDAETRGHGDRADDAAPPPLPGSPLPPLLVAPASGAPRPCLRFSGAVGGALPTATMARHLAGAVIERAELVVNGTTQVILEEMAVGWSFDEALAAAQAQGIVEPDPALDVDGWDAANKLVIFANVVLGQPTTLADLTVRGIREVSTAELEAAWGAGGRISVVGLAERRADGRYGLSVAPITLGPKHPLARLTRGAMGFVIQSDLAGRTTVTSLEDGPVGTCQAMIRDLLDIVT